MGPVTARVRMSMRKALQVVRRERQKRATREAVRTAQGMAAAKETCDRANAMFDLKVGRRRVSTRSVNTDGHVTMGSAIIRVAPPAP